LVENQFQVILIAPYDEYYNQPPFRHLQTFIWKHCHPRSLNPIIELKSLWSLAILLFKIRPDYLLTFTIKANIYGGLINFLIQSIHFPTISGIGQLFIQPLYAIGLKKSKQVLFQNYSDAILFVKEKIINEKNIVILPGSGVNLETFKPTSKLTYPKTFLFASRHPLEKGLNRIIEACKLLMESHPEYSVHFYGHPSKGYSNLPKNMKFKGFCNSMGSIYPQYCCFLYFSSYREGLPKVLLEALSSGTPILLAGPSCDSRILKSGYNGYKTPSLAPNDIHSLIIKWIENPESKKQWMRKNARKLALKKFSEKWVAQKYLQIIIS
jgi:glycosyltransferase involved in cell wall biosynthesis